MEDPHEIIEHNDTQGIVVDSIAEGSDNVSIESADFKPSLMDLPVS